MENEQKNTFGKNRVLLRRFLPYLRAERKTMALDLFCASLTTICEIVLPLIGMIYSASTVLSEPASGAALGQMLLAHGWTAWTAGAVMLFSLFHWPCSTTLLTIRRESGSWKWTLLAALLPTALGLCCCLLLRLVQLIVSG